MNEDKKQSELLSRRTALVAEKLKELNDKEVKEFEQILRTYRFASNNLGWTKIYLYALDKKLDANQKSLPMEIISNERYKSNQDFIQKVTLELKKEFYEYELEKMGLTYVSYQKEFELIKDEINNPNLSEAEVEKNELIVDLFNISLKIKVLQLMGFSFA
jgi:hypothetical protein